jgi:site-specific recombinase XerD
VRVNELLTITPRDIEPQNSVINVTKAKGGKQQRAHLDAKAITMLSEYVAAQQLPDDRPIFALKQRQVRYIVSVMVRSLEKMSIRIPSGTHMRSTVCETGGTSGGCSRCPGIRV